MRTQINYMTAWLRENRENIPDSMIESIELYAAAPKLTLSFSSEEELAEFGSRVLGEARVTKIENRLAGAHYNIIYRAELTWRKRQLNIFLVVGKAVSGSPEQIFNRTPATF